MKYIFSFIILLFSFCIIACDEDETFTSDINSVLRFSADTVMFDTVFTGVGSSTKRFKVYNPNSDGVRIANVRLASGGESGFQVNVNGLSGADFSDMELYHKDSMYVFVKLKANEQLTDEPTEIKDSLLFLLENGKEQKVLLMAYGQNATVLKALVVEEDMTLDNVRPYLIYDSLVIAPGKTLVVPEGTKLCFNNKVELIVRGTIVCYGTLERPVVFRGLRTDRMFHYLPYDRLDAQWGGITLAHESQGNVFECVDIHGGSYGVYCERVVEKSVFNGNVIEPLDESVYKLAMRNSSIHNVAADALCMNYWTGDFRNCEFSNAGGNCVTLIGGNTVFTHCTIAQFYPWNASRGAALYFSNVVNDTVFPLVQADFRNCYITGYADDEVYGARLEDGDAAFNCRFYNCALNTDTQYEGAEEFFFHCVSEKADTTAYKATNFKTIDTNNYIYDFRLDSLSIARGVGDAKFAIDVPQDKDGVTRPTERPDAGCYQYVVGNE